mmetsp:Transcript_11324/g.35956  ORF Transcript_11324/g.35956 Transcript_11324/m.35956 type:complete len:241 (+) Transcript_11324:588-1310(+)
MLVQPPTNRSSPPSLVPLRSLAPTLMAFVPRVRRGARQRLRGGVATARPAPTPRPPSPPPPPLPFATGTTNCKNSTRKRWSPALPTRGNLPPSAASSSRRPLPTAKLSFPSGRCPSAPKRFVPSPLAASPAAKSFCTRTSSSSSPWTRSWPGRTGRRRGCTVAPTGPTTRLPSRRPVANCWGVTSTGSPGSTGYTFPSWCSLTTRGSASLRCRCCPSRRRQPYATARLTAGRPSTPPTPP